MKMKRKHTQSKKARRASAFHKVGTYGSPSKKRMEKRLAFQAKVPKHFGKMVTRFQRIFLGKDRFGAPVYKTIAHAD